MLPRCFFLAAAILFCAACSDEGPGADAPAPEAPPEVKAANVAIDPAVGCYSAAEGILLATTDGTFGMHFEQALTASVEGAAWLTVSAASRSVTDRTFRFSVENAPAGGAAAQIVLRAGNAPAVRVAVTPPRGSDPDPLPDPSPNPNPDPDPAPNPNPNPTPDPDPAPSPGPDPSPYPVDLTYELALELSTVDNGFHGHNNYNGADYYPDRVEVYNAYPSVWGDRTAKTQTAMPYGFCTDAPRSYNRLSVPAFGDEVFVFRGYRGEAGSQYNSGGITIVNARFSQVFFRQIRFTLPIPAGVLPSQKVVYRIVVEHITANAEHDTPQISFEIVDR